MTGSPKKVWDSPRMITAYKIASTVQEAGWGENDVYVGSTSQKLTSRLATHRYNAKNYVDVEKPLYEIMRKYGVDNFFIIEVKKRQCHSFEEQLQLEREVYDFFSPKWNRCRPCITEEERKAYAQEYRDSHKSERKVYHEKYYSKNRDKVLDRLRKNRERNLEEQKHRCDVCDRNYTSSASLAAHLGTKKHQKNVAQKENPDVLQDPIIVFDD